MSPTKHQFEDEGVTLSKSKIFSGDKITLTYRGCLASQGATDIYAHMGYGPAWDDSETLKMEEKSGIFKLSFIVKQNGMLNICFKDGSENWDNNQGKNYSFDTYQSPEEQPAIEAPKRARSTSKTGILTAVAKSAKKS